MPVDDELEDNFAGELDAFRRVDGIGPVYAIEQKPGSLESFAVCRFCKLTRRTHVPPDRKCLFDATTFSPLIRKETNEDRSR